MFSAYGKQLRQPSGLMGRLVSKMMQMRNGEFYKKTIRELDVRTGEKIFEIGYGPGLGINLIASMGVDCFIGGIDFSELMYREAIKRNKKFIDSGMVSLYYGDLLKFDPDHYKYDKIFCVNVIYFWSELNQVFDKIHSMLNPGGLFYIFMIPAEKFESLGFAKDFHKYPIEKVVSELKNSGFTQVEYKLDKGYYIKAVETHLMRLPGGSK